MFSWGHNEVCCGVLTMWVLIVPAVHLPGVQGTEHASGGGSHNDPVPQFLPMAPRGCVLPWSPYGGEGVHLPCICHCVHPADAARSYRALEAVHVFNPYDLYSKTDELADPVKLRPYYESLIAKFFLSYVD